MQPIVETSQSGNVLNQLGATLLALVSLLISLIQAILPWTPLLLWIAFWLLAVNWRKLYPVLWSQQGLIGILLIGLTAILAWSSIVEPVGGVHRIFGLQLDNFVGKTVYVTSLWLIAALCGKVQLSGACGSLCKFEEDLVPVTDDHAVADSHH